MPESLPLFPPNDDAGDGSFRAQAHCLVDWIADYLSDLDSYPVFPAIRPGTVRDALPEHPPTIGEPFADVMRDVEQILLPAVTHWNHPGFMAYFNSSASAPGILGELLTAALNANAMLWASCPAATELETVTLGWLRQSLGLPEAFWGILYEGGSASNLHALAAARDASVGPSLRQTGLAAAARLRVYASELTHSSVAKAAITLGLGLDAVCSLPVDAAYRLRPDALEEAVAVDRRYGWTPFAVVATLGTTSCTSVDPVAEIAALCERESLWLHVDAAHGGALAMLPECGEFFAGWERADSITVNPHKWFFVPLDCSALFIRHPDVLRRAFSLVPDYLQTSDDAEHFMDYGVTLGRRFRALKLWMVLRHFGVEGLKSRYREHLRLAQLLSAWIDASPLFERMAPVPMSTVCLRYHPPGRDPADLDALNSHLLETINATGEVYLTPTVLRGRRVIRIVLSGLRVDERHVRRAWELLQTCAAAV